MVLANMSKRSFHIPGDERSEPPFQVVHCLLAFEGLLDSRRFAAMLCDGDKLTVFDTRTMKECDTLVGAWVRRWRHWGRRGASTGRCVSDDVYSPFICWYVEVDYERELERVVARY